MDKLTYLSLKQKPRREPKYWEAWQCGKCVGSNNSVQLLRHEFRFSKGVTFRCVR